MKSINFILLIYFLVMTNSTFSQMDCSVNSPRTTGDIPDAYQYIPDENTPVKYLRINIHYILKEQGTQGYPGNFTKYDDGNGNTGYTGYDYANDFIDMANYRLYLNTQMKMPPGNSTDVLPRQYRFILNGVFFHEDNDYYVFSIYNVPTIYNINTGDAINVYLNLRDNANGGGVANMSGNRYVVIKNTWESYLSNYPNPALWVPTGTLVHETGHNLSLYHTMLTNGGTCNPTQEDYCADTPTGQFIIDNYSFDPCCGWGGGTNCTNNIMDYTGDDAITPLQLGREHWTIANEMFRYKICYFNTSSIDITSFTDNMAYVASSVTIPAGYSILVNN